MTMLSPLDLDLPVMWHREKLLREAESERLAAQLPRRRVPTFAIRPQLSALLRALADRLEPAGSTAEPAPAP